MSSFKSYLISEDVLDLTKSGVSRNTGGVVYLYFYNRYILKTKSNFTLFSTEYIYTHSDFKQIKYCNEFPILSQTQFVKNSF